MYDNGGSLHNRSMLAVVEMSAHTNGINGPPNFISTQSSNMGMVQGINGSLIKPESVYSGNSPYVFGDASVTTFTNVESTAHPPNDSLLGLDTSAFGYLGQISGNFSLSDLTSDFTLSSGLSSVSCSYVYVACFSFLLFPYLVYLSDVHNRSNK